MLTEQAIAWVAAAGWAVESVWTGLFAAHAYRPYRSGRLGFVLGFFSSWFTLELAPHFLIFHVLISALAILFGAFEVWLGWVALLPALLTLAMLANHWLGGRRADETVANALDELDVAGSDARIPVSKFLNPFRPARRGVRLEKDIEYARVRGRSLKLDVFRPEAPSEEPHPVIVQLHGGAWIFGDKREQGLPLLYHLAANGWVGFNVNYGLSPAATWPEHLIDIKRALAWIHEHADEYGIDPDFIAVTGGSAGGHLTAMVALTPNDPRYQPGFEAVDTTVHAAVPIYGVYDFVDRKNLLGRVFREKMLEPVIMKKFFDEEPDAFHRASPIDRVRADAPPFFVIHGARDTLAPIEYAQEFVEKLRETSNEPVYYAELKGAQHAFDVFLSPRTARVIYGIQKFLDAMRANRKSARDLSGATPLAASSTPHPELSSSNPGPRL